MNYPGALFFVILFFFGIPIFLWIKFVKKKPITRAIEQKVEIAFVSICVFLLILVAIFS